MKLLYLANVRLPTEKAHGAQIMNMCAALASVGANVELVAPRRHNPISDDPFEYYALASNFTIARLWTLDSIHWGLGYWTQLTTFGLAALFYALRSRADIYYSRDEFILYLLSFFRKNLVWESHTGRYNFIVRRILKSARLVITITGGMRDFYVQRGVAYERIIVAHDGVDLELFKEALPVHKARSRLGLPVDGKIVLYAGRLDGWKGVATLCAASALLPQDIRLAVIGGENSEITVFRKKYPRVLFAGYRPYREIAQTLSAADVLVLPNTGRDQISARFTSPLKLFAYMASGKPIVASDLPSIREVIDEHSAYFVSPDNPHALAKGIVAALEDGTRGMKAARARERVAAYTWSARAQKILRALQKRHSVPK